MNRVLVPLAEGCEDLEAVTITDLLVRAGAEVVRAGLNEDPVTGGRGTKMIPDTTLEAVKNEVFDLIAIPGGRPGADHLAENEVMRDIVTNHMEAGRWLGAICAGPRVLAAAGLLHERIVTCFPGALDGLVSADTKVTENSIEIDDRLITAKGPGVAMDFTLTLIEKIFSEDQRQAVEAPLQRPDIHIKLI